ncbi:glycosyltransferase family 2 protein [Priestia megaterium]|uniref:glycosyltransferase family 2 protein n=1 Tax=Priestia megaterium TaxID=1404 RepID=UPI002EC3C39A|nr:glycosyltransferase family 2 protein [Priestia megaterium]
MAQVKKEDIHVIIINCSSSYNLEKMLLTLKSLEGRIENITILDEDHINLQTNNYSLNKFIQRLKLIEEDIGTTLNNHIQKIECDYILFLNNNAFFTSNIIQKMLLLNDNHQVLTYTNLIKGEIIESPLLIRTSFLKNNKFFKKYQIPFKEALFSSWLARIDKKVIKNVDREFVKHSPMGKSQSTSQKNEFISKYQNEAKSYESMPSISIMISNYNMEKYVEVAVNSCFLQTQLPQNIFVIDDGSTDNSYENLTNWIVYPEFKLLNTENIGKAKALNKVLECIDTDFVLELDADDWLDPNALEVIKGYLKSLSQSVALLYGNLRLWKQAGIQDVRYAGIRKGKPIFDKKDLISYFFPLGPRIYRTSALKSINGFPVIEFKNGRMYEDVSVINKLIEDYQLSYRDFTVYNVREHNLSITKKNHSDWSDFLKYLD